MIWCGMPYMEQSVTATSGTGCRRVTVVNVHCCNQDTSLVAEQLVKWFPVLSPIKERLLSFCALSRSSFPLSLPPFLPSPSYTHNKGDPFHLQTRQKVPQTAGWLKEGRKGLACEQEIVCATTPTTKVLGALLNLWCEVSCVCVCATLVPSTVSLCSNSLFTTLLPHPK